MKRILLGIAIATLVLSSAPAAFAQQPGGGGGAPAATGGGGKDEGYGYEFSDDPLAQYPYRKVE